tara:strand:- start:311 stop:562 length:252 start_codon:yes stop_codon:yes gene_type:complete
VAKQAKRCCKKSCLVSHGLIHLSVRGLSLSTGFIRELSVGNQSPIVFHLQEVSETSINIAFDRCPERGISGVVGGITTLVAAG